MKRILLSIIAAAGLMLGTASQINAMETFLAVNTARSGVIHALDALREYNQTEVLNRLSRQGTLIEMRASDDTVAINLDIPKKEWVIWDHNKMKRFLKERHGVVNPDGEGQKSIAILSSHPDLIIKRSAVSPINISESANEYRDRLSNEREQLLRATDYSSEEGIERQTAKEIAWDKWNDYPGILPSGWSIPTAHDMQQARAHGEGINNDDN